jgi:hypothetical protein
MENKDIEEVSRETNAKETSEKLEEVKRGPDGRLLPGSRLNPENIGIGRPQGRRDFVTDFEEAIKGIKDKDTGEQLTMQKIIQTGLKKMMQGNGTKFESLYMDLVDRVYGKSKQTTEITGLNGTPLIPDSKAKADADALIAELINDHSRNTPR